MSEGLTVRRATPEEIRMLGGAEYVSVPAAVPAVVQAAAVPVAAPVAPPAAPPTVSAPAAVAAAQGAPAVAPAELEDGVVVLSKAYPAHGEPVNRIKLRRPVARDIGKCGGLPVRPVFNDGGQIASGADIKWDVVIKYVVALSVPPLPPSTVDGFDFVDIESCADVLLGFFLKRD